jgi:hypothetical protein
MTPKTIFVLILKIIGLYMVLDLITLLPQTIARFPLMGMNSGSDIFEKIIYILIVLVILLVYFFLMRIFLFKTDWIIKKLSLDKHFEQEIISIKVDSAAVIQIAIIVLGGIIFTDALPTLLRDIISYLQQKQLEIILAKSPGFSYLVFDVCKLTVGYLLLTNCKQITLWIEKKSKDQENTVTEDTSLENKEKK